MNERLFVRLEEDTVHGPEAGAPEGTLRSLPIRAALRPYLSHILVYRETFATGREIVERVIPDGAVRIALHLGDHSSEGAVEVIGPSALPAMVRLHGRIHGLALTLRPGAARALLGVPAGALAGQVVSLDALWGRGAAGDLVDRLAARASDSVRAGALQDALLRGLRTREPAVDQVAVAAWRRIVAGGGSLSVGRLAAGIGVGERRLQQLFKAQIGLPPRTWRRLARIHACIRTLRQTAPPWADLAAGRGFYDQAHLIREFRELCGCTPVEFLQQAVSGSSNTGR